MSVRAERESAAHKELIHCMLTTGTFVGHYADFSKKYTLQVLCTTAEEMFVYVKKKCITIFIPRHWGGGGGLFTRRLYRGTWSPCARHLHRALYYWDILIYKQCCYGRITVIYNPVGNNTST